MGYAHAGFHREFTRPKTPRLPIVLSSSERYARQVNYDSFRLSSVEDPVMIKLVATALTALAVLGVCNSSNQDATPSAAGNNGSASATQAQAPVANQVSGTISLRE